MNIFTIVATMIIGGLMTYGLAVLIGVHPIFIIATGVAGLGALVAYEKIVYKL